MVESFRDRMVSFITEGDAAMVDTMLSMKDNLVSDYWGGESNENSTNSEQLMSYLHVVALYPIDNYMKIIDVLLNYEIDINSLHKNYTPLDTAIINKNFPTAAYLQYRGGIYTFNSNKFNSTTDYFNQMDTSLLSSLEVATWDLHEILAGEDEIFDD